MPNALSTKTRRRFLQDSLAATTAAMLPCHTLAQAPTQHTANDTIRVAILGCGVRGPEHARAFGRQAGIEIAYVCDPDQARVQKLADQVAKQQGRRPQAVADMRRVFDDRSIDVVTVAAPNHWHALAAIWAMQAGKEVYAEKPVSHNIHEGRRMVQVARQTGRICQVGTQMRSSAAWAEAIDYIRQGKLGDVRLARSIITRRREPIGGPGKYPIPKGVDYDLWSGPAPMHPYLTRPNLQYDWHWFWETGNGELGNNNIHMVDLCRWGLAVGGMGRAVLSYGGRLAFSDAGQTPNTQVVIHDFVDKTIVQETRDLKSQPYSKKMKLDPSYACILYGTEGIIANAALYDPDEKFVRNFSHGPDPGGPVDFFQKTLSHVANFLDVVRSRNRKQLRADILEGHQSTSLCHVGNISYRLGQPASPADIQRQLAQLKVNDNVQETFDRTRRHLANNGVDIEKTRLTLGVPLDIDPEAEVFVDDAQANALLTRRYREPFVVPG